MKKITIIFVVITIALTVLFGPSWWQSQQAYKAAEQYIETRQVDQKYNVIDLRDFPKLKKIPKNIQNIEGLKYLYAQNTDVSDISTLRNIGSLTNINLRGTKVKDISVLGTIPTLTLVDLGKTPVRDLSPLTLNKNLERLDIGNTHTLTLEPATRIMRLNWLNLYQAMSDDGSQTHYEELVARRNIDIQPGNRFKDNYIPR